MDHVKVHNKMKFKLIIHKLQLWKSIAFTSLKILQNDFVHHIVIQIKILKPSSYKEISISI